ncbi:DUF1684 domain-containing protein [Micromonospora sp. NPDC049679]|uniref:DUF1684 domain-containing protein n=1 Tax=Micromonospora sp. NPDC049679 TaxID=3155920 RepID=UPI0033D43C8D
MTTIERDTLVNEWVAWRVQRADELREPHGWLSVTALHWLTGELSAYWGMPGRWNGRPAGVTVKASPDEGLVLHGRQVLGTVLVEVADGAPPARATFADKIIEIMQRNGRYAIRLRDPRAVSRTWFAGVPAYDPSPEWIVEGWFQRYDQPRTVVLGSVIDGLTHRQRACGVVRFNARGEDHALTAFGRADGGLWLPFRDATSGVTTYAAARSLSVGQPAEDGRLILDFNRATNPPCAFIRFATCALPPPENTLALAVEAGEKSPQQVVGGTAETVTRETAAGRHRR